VKVTGFADKTFAGEVYFIDPRVDPSTRTVKVKARIANADGELRPGLFANVELITGARDDALVVPEQAVVPAIDKLTVFVVENGIAHRREVTVGARLPGKVEITSGLKDGEVVVIAGQQKLRDGVPVQPVAKPAS
jgi:membrane fusion protein (multidrug efflux system)